MNSLAPAIRFKGFSSEWNIKKIGDVAELGSSKRIHSRDYVSTGVPFYRGSEISNGAAPSDSELYISIQSYQDIKKKYGVPNYGDLLVTAVGTLGNIWKVDNRTFYYKDGNLIHLSKLSADSDFFFSYLSDGIGNRRLLDSAAGSNQKALTMVKMREISIFLPHENEQAKIGIFFKKIDETITLHQHALFFLKQRKKAFLQKMFPKKGESFPEIRFSGFKEKWETYHVDEVTNIYDNLRKPVTASKRTSGNIPYYGANGIQDYVEGYTHNGEFVLVAEDGASDLIHYPVNYVNGEVWVNNHAHVLSGKVKVVNNLFLAIRIKSMNISKYLVGGGRAKLNGSILKKIKIKVPSYEEQERIGNFFKELDNSIDLQEEKLESLKKMKKAFLQKMFV